MALGKIVKEALGTLAEEVTKEAPEQIKRVVPDEVKKCICIPKIDNNKKMTLIQVEDNFRNITF